MTAIRVRGLHKHYGGVPVVAGLDLDIRRGECFGLLGPNGAGKTTTLRLILGLIHPDAGELSLLGEPVPQRAREARYRVGVVPQFDSLDPDFSVAENLLIFGRYFGLDDAQVRARLPELLAFSDLQDKAGATIRSLSGGMKRRLTLARSLVNDPDLVILDEPTTGLDPQARHLIWQRLRGLRQRGKTLLLTTHFMEEAERLCDRLAIIDRGRIIAQGSPRELVAAHIEPHVVEVFDLDGCLPQELESAAQRVARMEIAGETGFFYLHDPAPFMACLEGRRYLHRPANLEDVFIKLTGRDLRD